MPPPYFERSLTTDQIELIRRWIDEGARWEIHWAFEPPAEKARPKVKHKEWPINDIDYFVLARLESEGLEPSPPADKATLLRRLTLDLTGLPPTLTEIDAFLADDSPQAYEHAVDRILSSAHYGERMAIQWLDLARYADSNGYHIDNLRDMWPWRDWVINAFNRNMPFDQFTVEQLAGDLLPDASVAQKVATGFSRNHMINFEGGAVPEEYQTEYVVDRVETTATVWLGLTMGCARCHDHKYDPIKQKEFYQFFAFFNTVPERGLDGRKGNSKPFVHLPSRQQEERLAALERKTAAIEQALPEAEIQSLIDDWKKIALPTIPAASREGLLSHYEFDGDLADSVSQAVQGKVLRGELAFREAPAGRGVEFDAETHLTFDSTFLKDGKPFSMAFWIRPKHTALLLRTVLQKLDPAQGRRGLEVLVGESRRAPPGRMASHVYVRLAHQWPDKAIEIRTRERVVPGDLGIHITITYDGSGGADGFKLYANGTPEPVEVIRDSLSGAVFNTMPLEIGNKRTGKAYRGQFDDLRIYDRVLSREEEEVLVVHEPMRAVLASPIDTCAEILQAYDEERQADIDGVADLVNQAFNQSESGRRLRACQSRRDRFRDYYLRYAAPGEYQTLHVQLQDLRSEKKRFEETIPTTMVMDEMKRPRATFVLGRGDYRDRGERVRPGVPAVLSSMPSGAPLNRLGLARWLVDPAHPLTARVTVNRYWQTYFGTGLVRTSENFGSQGETPSHPKLLDWLAFEFIRSGWNVKDMQRLIVTSATYRQSSRLTSALLETDPGNRLFTRGARFRLPAEMVRDNALAVSGLLQEEIGGPSVSPYQPRGLWKEMAFGNVFTGQEYAPGTGKDLYRRSLYTVWKRTVPPPSLLTFDAPDREECTSRRGRTNTPLQALILMNDPTYVEAARALAERMITEAGPKPSDRVRLAYRLAVAREPSGQELEVLLRLAKAQQEDYQKDKDTARALLSVGESQFNQDLRVSELAAWTTVASTILNLDEVITKE